MKNEQLGLSNIDNELHEICKDIEITYNSEDDIKDGHIISNNAIITGSIFPQGKYPTGKDDGSFDKLLKYMSEKQ